MVKKCRQLHLWIGLFTSILILIEAATGLIMLEPWLIGVNQPAIEQGSHSEKANMVNSSKESVLVEGPVPQGGGFNNNNNLMGFIRNLHQGRIGSTNIAVFLDIAAIGLIMLSITGIILSVKVLKAQFFAKN